MNLRRSLHRFAAALGVSIAIGGGAIAFAQATCGTNPGQLRCFDPWAAGEMWRSLDTILTRTTPDLDGNGSPDSAKAWFTGLLNEFGDEIWVSLREGRWAADHAMALTEIGPGECTFSHLGDPLYSTRVCKDPLGALVPPPAGKVLYPAGVTVYKDRVYVADRMNHRVQVVDFFGNPLPIAKPIGNGEPGTGKYVTRYPGQAAGQEGWRVTAPAGLAVDANGIVMVAEGGLRDPDEITDTPGFNPPGRISLFNGLTGDVAFTDDDLPTGNPVHKTIAAGIEGGPVVPTSVAISPGAQLVKPGTIVPATDAARIVVLNRFKCSMKVYDRGFNEVWQYPTIKPSGSDIGTSCVASTTSNATGIFSIMTGATIDAAGRIYVVDSYNNRVQVFSRDGVLLGMFGEPVDPANPNIEALETPSSILIDHNGRVVVNDSDNLRIAFFNVTFPGPASAPVAQFLFEVPAAGDDHEDYPTGLAEQWGTVAEGLDPAGRYLKVDTAGQRLQRLELADLSIVQASAKSGQGFFNVAVPSEKANFVRAVRAAVQPGELDANGKLDANGFAFNAPAGVAVTLVEDIAPATAQDDDIYPGSWVKFRFTYTDTNLPPLDLIKFVITARGNESTPQQTDAPPVQVTVRGDCVNCDATVAVFKASAPNTPAPATLTPTGSWYSEPVLARLVPSGLNAAQVTHIEWSIKGSDLVYYGNGIRQTPLPTGARFVDVLLKGKSSDVMFYAVVGNSVGPERTQNVKVDLEGPAITFNFLTADRSAFITAPSGVDPSGFTWWNRDVSATYSVVDDKSGTAAPNGVLTITGSGFDLWRWVTEADRVGHQTTALSNDLSLSGAVINIDRVGPVITAPANLVLPADLSGLVTIPASFGTSATATDALSGVNGGVIGTGPLVVPNGQTVTWTFTATDWAGNTSSVTRTVTAGGGSTCIPVSIALNQNGNATSGKLGNVRTFNSGGVHVTATAWSRLRSADTWAKAYLGAYGAYGLGVTDSSEGRGANNTHKVDNITRHNYVVFQFSKPVTVTKALITSLGADGDATVWIGTSSGLYTTPLPMNDAALHSLGAPWQSTSTSTADRLMTFNGANVQGNVLVIAADVTDTTPEDAFKIARLELTCGGAANLPPTVSGHSQSDDEGESVSLQIEATDPNGDALTYSASGLPPGLSINPTTGLISGTLSYNSAPSYDVTITVRDAAGLTGTVSFVWTVVNKNRPPDAVNDKLKTSKNTPKTMSVIANDRDPDGDTIKLESVSTPAGFKGTVTTYSNGTIKYTPPPNWTGTTSFSYTVSDGKGGTDTATVAVTVASHSNTDGCDDDHDHDGDSDHDDDRERDCDRDHRHSRDCDRDDDHDRDCRRDHSSTRNCNDDAGWYNWRYRD